MGTNQGNASGNSRNDKANALFSIVVSLHGTFVLLLLQQEIPITLVLHSGGDAHDRDRDASNTEENTFFVRLSERVLSLFYISFVFMDKVMKWRRVMCTSPLYPLFMIK